MFSKVFSRQVKWCLWVGLLLIVIGMLCPQYAHAATTGGQGLPWEQGVSMIANSLTGPIAYSLVLIGAVCSIWSIFHGGEITGFAKSMILVALAGAALILVKQVIQQLVGTGALIN